MKRFFLAFALLLLIYMLMPGPGAVTDFSNLPNSYKSTLSGDTWQVANISAYFSDNFRDFATSFYLDQYRQQTWLPFGPLRLNHPPEFAYTAVKDQTQSTYLEEFVYPLRGSLFVNGLEPYLSDFFPRYKGATPFITAGGTFHTKVTLRYYPASVTSRLVTWLGICLAMVLVWKVGKKIFKPENLET